MSTRTITSGRRRIQPVRRTSAAATHEQRAVAGDEAAWDELFRIHNRRVVLLLLTRGLRADVARDVAQEAWLRLIQQQRRGRLASLSLPGLVVKQAMFVAKERARTKEARTAHVPMEDVDASLDAEKALLDRDRLHAARDVIAHCSPSQQRVFHAMYARPGSSSSEVARVTGLSVQRVRQIVCEVRKRVRAALEDSDA